MRKVLIASASVIAINCSAFASDLPNSKTAPLAPVVNATKSWTGCYAGINGGLGSQSSKTQYQVKASYIDEGSNTGSGGLFGGQIGCDYQSGNVVFGVQGLVDWTNLSGSNEYTDNEGGVLTTDARWSATLAGRVGYTVQPETLIYLKGGVAWINNENSDQNNVLNIDYPKNNVPYTTTGKSNAIKTGWIVGAGIEQKLSLNMSIFIEYNYLDFGSKLVELTDENDFKWSNKYDNHAQVGLIGINYRF